MELRLQRGWPPTSSPGRMLIFWAHLASLRPVLALVSGSQPCWVQHFSPVLDSLRCYNDYRSHIRCSWRESGLTHAQVPLSLYHLDVERDFPSKCEPLGPPESLSAGEFQPRCQYNTTLFGISVKDSYFFETPHSPALSKTLSVPQLVRVRPPHSLSQVAMEGGGSVLRWNSSYLPSSPLYPTLNYQVSYRRLGQDWMDVEVSEEKLELAIESDFLVPGCWYEARVRGRGGKGLWSDWSPLVEWRTEEVSVPGPHNLQCVFDGEETMSCSWEMKTDLAQFVIYNLSYRTDPTAPFQQCCSDAPAGIDTRVSVLRLNCSFTISQPGQLLVKLTPSNNTREIKSYKHIRPIPPDPVSVQEKGGDWLLSWTRPKPSKCRISFQVRYWRSQAPKEIIYYNISEGGFSHLFYASSLRPSVEYTAEVRAQVIGRGQYAGLPSDWTKPVHWTTHPAPWSNTLLLPLCVAVPSECVAILFLWFAVPACRRWVRAWKMSIPSPYKSKVLEETRKRSTDKSLVYQNDYGRVFISKIEVLDMHQAVGYVPQFSESEESSPRLWLMTTEEGDRQQQFSKQVSRVAANATSSDPRILFSPGLEPQSEGAVSGPSMPDGASLLFLSTSQDTPPQCETEYMPAPFTKSSAPVAMLPRCFVEDLEVQDMCLHNGCPLLGPDESDTEEHSSLESLHMESCAYMPIPFNIPSENKTGCCPASDPRMANRGAAFPSVYPVGCAPGGLGENGGGWPEDIKEDYTYLNLSEA